jgi:hypothetical protein
MAKWKVINFKSIKEEFIYSSKFSMPFFPKIFWRIKLYPLIKKTDSTVSSNFGDNCGLVLCADGNLFANHGFTLGSGFRAKNTPQTVEYFCSDNSESGMYTFSYSSTFSNDVLITCTITVPFDSYIGGQSLETFQYGRKVLDKQKHCDFVIKVQGESFNVHKCILSTHWPHFDALLKSGMSETSSGMLTIEDEMPDAIEAMIYYIYTGTSNVTDVNVALELITVSDKYDLPDLKTKSLKFVITKMNEYCVIKALFKAKLHGLDDLLEACIDFLKKDETEINDLPNYNLLAESENAIELLTLCFDNVRGIKRKLVTFDEEE